MNYRKSGLLDSVGKPREDTAYFLRLKYFVNVASDPKRLSLGMFCCVVARHAHFASLFTPSIPNKKLLKTEVIENQT